MVIIEPWARKYIGTPFQVMGRSFSNVDCYGLHWLIEKTEAGIEMPTFDFKFDCRKKEQINTLLMPRKSLWRRIEKPQSRCVVLINIMGVSAHMGVMAGVGVMIHADDDHGKVLAEPIPSPVYPPSVIEGYYVYVGENA